MNKRLIMVWGLFVCACRAQAQYAADWDSLDKRPVPQWWREAKFGIMIHWGVYAVPAYAPTDMKSVYAKYAEWYAKRLQEKDGNFTRFHARTYGDHVSYADFAWVFKITDPHE